MIFGNVSPYTSAFKVRFRKKHFLCVGTLSSIIISHRAYSYLKSEMRFYVCAAQCVHIRDLLLIWSLILKKISNVQLIPYKEELQQNKRLMVFKNRNGRKRMFQIKETRRIIILLYYTEKATLKLTSNGTCPTTQRLASCVLELTGVYLIVHLLITMTDPTGDWLSPLYW